MRRKMWRPSQLTVYRKSRLAGNANLESIVANSAAAHCALSRIYAYCKPCSCIKTDGTGQKSGFYLNASGLAGWLWLMQA